MKQVYYAVLMFSLLTLVSCAAWDNVAHESDELTQLKQEKEARLSSQEAAEPTVFEENTDALQNKKHHISLQRVILAGSRSDAWDEADWGDGVVLPHPIGTNGTLPPAEGEDDELMISVENMELNHFVHLIFGTYLKVNYMVDPNVEKRKDPVTIHMQEPVSNAAFRRLVRELLKKYSVAVKTRDDMVFLEPLQKRMEVEEDYQTFTGHSLPVTLADSEQVLILVPFLYVDPNHYVGVFNIIIPPESVSSRVVLPGKNMLLKGEAGSVRKMLALIRSIDKPYLQDQEVRLVTLQYIVPEDLVKRMEELLPPFGIPVYSEKSTNGIRLLPMPEIGALFLISPKKEWLQEAMTLIDKLDGPLALGPEPRIFIYRPQNRKASVLAEIIMGLRNGGGGKINTSSQEEKLFSTTEKGKKNSKMVPPKLVKTGGVALKEGQLVITVDEGRNALVVFTTPVVYKELVKVLKDLDTLTRQVLIEVTIAEVTLTDSLQYGVEWFLQTSGSKGDGVISTLGNLGLGGSGVLSVFTSTAGDFVTMLNAFAEDDLINILANPRLVVLDNESASFSVGTDVPVVTSEATAEDISSENSPSVLRNIQYRKTGINVEVTPTIYSNGTLRLEINQNLSEAQKNDVSPETGSPLILDRASNTTVILKSGEAILLAGLISETKSNGNQRIPLLGDIPFIGNLFKTTSEQTTRTELMMQVRPVILDTPEDMRIQTLEYEKAVKDLLRLNKFFN